MLRVPGILGYSDLTGTESSAMKAKRRIRLTMALLTPALLICHAVSAQQSGVLGFWKEPGGSVIHIENCGSDVCATLVALSRSAPARVDRKNPNRTLQQRSICGLRIGQGFHLSSPSKAEGGTLYDPKSGKTYQGTMSSSQDQLNLRGFVGLPIFGRSEKWARTGAVETCRAEQVRP
ncbi:MAG: hypothetical protein NVSMB62_21810 [Acidobacteriaceae bacterium]